MAADGVFIEWVMGGGVLAIAGFSIATYRSIAKIKEEVDRKVNRTFERLDEVKEKTEERFVFKDVCKILHEQTARDIIDIKTNIQLLLKQKEVREK